MNDKLAKRGNGVTVNHLALCDSIVRLLRTCMMFWCCISNIAVSWSHGSCVVTEKGRYGKN